MIKVFVTWQKYVTVCNWPCKKNSSQRQRLLVTLCYMNDDKENNTLWLCKNITHGVVFLYLCFYDANRLQLIPFLFWKTVLSPNQTNERSACLVQTSHTHGFYKNINIKSIDTWLTKVQFDMETDSLDLNVSCNTILSRRVPQFT